MIFGSTEWQIADNKKTLAVLERNYKEFQNDRAERAFEMTKEEDEEILNILDEIAERYKKLEKEIEQLERAGV